MIYYSDETILIRDLRESDAPIITDEEIAQGWHQTIDKYLLCLSDQAKGISINLVAEYRGNIAGYINVYPGRKAGPFQHGLWPEIVDFGVLEKYRRNGIGSKLMDVAEEIAGRYADTVYLGVGLYCGYGSAQRMYCKRGYIPDGTGVWYGRSPCVPYENYCVDDDLVLYLTKKLR
ncbi:MAG: GNAT family N-acetyltransferase [Ruminococcaceae bacterium]|nr:GNAT family N-acetyltransferase [Oscillospiraceae bacterium]